MIALDVLTVVSMGLLAGNELAVSAFANPAVWRLEEHAKARALRLLAKALGGLMPIWYGLCLLLLGLATYLHRQDEAFRFLLAASVIWALVIVYTIALMVPINNRIAALDENRPSEGWLTQHKRWDRLHRWRVFFLTVSLVCLALGLVR
jgi:uncharacterized membrane protein